MTTDLGSTIQNPRRLAALAATGLLDTPSEEPFDRLTRLAATALQAPISRFCLVDRNRLYFKSTYSLGGIACDLSEVPLSDSFCQHTVYAGGTVVIPDTRLDPRVRDSHLIEEDGLLAYTGTPVRDQDGFILGTLCVLDVRPHAWRQEDTAMLEQIADLATAEIDRRQLAQEAERERREKTNILDSITDSFMVVDRQWRLTFLNRQAETRAGATTRTLRGKTIWEVFPRAADSRFRCVGEAGMASRQPFAVEEYYEPLGLWVLVRGYPHEDGLAIYMQDVTARKQAELALRDREARYRLVAQVANDAIWDADLSTGLVERGEGFQTLFGYGENEVGTSMAWWLDRVHPDDRERVRQVLAGASINTPRVETEYRFRRADGSYALVADRGCFLHDLSGKPVRLVGATADITERRRAEEALRASEQRHRLTVAVMTDVTYDWNIEQDEDWWSDGVTRRFGHPAGRIENAYARWESLLHPDDREWVMASLDAAVKSDRDTWAEEYRYRKADGTYAVVVDANHFIRDGSGRAVRAIGALRDVTEQRRNEEALRESEQRFRLLAENVQDLICLHQPDGRYLYLSPSCEHLLGYPREALMGTDPFDLLHPEDAPRVREQMHTAVVLGRTPGSVTYRIRRQDGAYTWFETLAMPIADLQGNVVRLETTSRDVSERVRAEQEREQSLSLLRATLESTADGILVVGQDGRINSFNRRFAEMWRLPDSILASRNDKEAIDRVLSQLVAPAEFIAKVEELYGHPERESYDVLQFKDGRLFERYSLPQRLGDQIVGRVWSFRDVTEQRRAEATLRQSRQDYESLVHSIDGIVWTADLNTEGFLFVSQQAERLLGYPVEIWTDPAYPRFWHQHLHPDDRDHEVARYRAAVAEGRDYEAEYRMIAADGRVVWLRDLTKIIKEGGRVVAIRGVMVDITQQKQAEELLQRREEELRHAQKLEAVGRLAGGIAHDFNNLLTAIIGYSDLLSMELGDDSRRSEVDEIRKAADRAAELTRQLLAFSRKQVLKPVTLDVNQAVAGLEGLLRRLIGEDIQLTKVPAPEPAWVRADPSQLEQVIANLVVNARDAMPHGGLLSISVESIGCDRDHPLPRGSRGSVRPPSVLLTVRDTGTGMDAATLERLFEPFFTTKELGKGTGLGLATVYGIVQQSGGEIWVESEINQGTAFHLLLPAAAAPANPAPAPSLPAAPASGRESIVLVEDEPRVRALARTVLERYGYTVLEAAGGAQALAMAQDHRGPIHLVISDVVMPGMTGPEVGQAFVGLIPGVKILLISGYAETVLTRHGASIDTSPLLLKPFTPEELARKVREVLDGN